MKQAKIVYQLVMKDPVKSTSPTNIKGRKAAKVIAITATTEPIMLARVVAIRGVKLPIRTTTERAPAKLARPPVADPRRLQNVIASRGSKVSNMIWDEDFYFHRPVADRPAAAAATTKAPAKRGSSEAATASEGLGTISSKTEHGVQEPTSDFVDLVGTTDLAPVTASEVEEYPEVDTTLQVPATTGTAHSLEVEAATLPEEKTTMIAGQARSGETLVGSVATSVAPVRHETRALTNIATKSEGARATDHQRSVTGALVTVTAVHGTALSTTEREAIPETKVSDTTRQETAAAVTDAGTLKEEKASVATTEQNPNVTSERRTTVAQYEPEEFSTIAQTTEITATKTTTTARQESVVAVAPPVYRGRTSIRRGPSIETHVLVVAAKGTAAPREPQHCPQYHHAAIEGRCLPVDACNEANDCPSGQTCAKGYQTRWCNTAKWCQLEECDNTNCQSPRSCLNGYCSAGCSSDGRCPAGQVCQGDNACVTSAVFNRTFRTCYCVRCRPPTPSRRCRCPCVATAACPSDGLSQCRPVWTTTKHGPRRALAPLLRSKLGRM